MPRSPLLVACAIAVFAAGAACEADGDAPLPLPGGSAGPTGGVGGAPGAEGGGGTVGGGEAVGGGGAAPDVPPCERWEGPFGSAPPALLDPNTRWEGFLPGAIGPGDVDVRDLVACGGNDEVRALVVYIDAVWCDVCRNVARGLADRYAGSWRDRGVALVSLLVEDADGNPADLESAWQWRSTYGLDETYVAIDPAYALADDRPDTLPQALVIDPRTMRIHARAVGDVDLDPLVEQVLAGGAAE
jgi:hypothetical protein